MARRLRRFIAHAAVCVHRQMGAIFSAAPLGSEAALKHRLALNVGANQFRYRCAA